MGILADLSTAVRLALNKSSDETMKSNPAHFKPNELLRKRVSVFTLSYALVYLFVLLLVVGHNYKTTYVNVVISSYINRRD